MKKYKLVKDSPTFNAGDEFVLVNGDLYYVNRQAPKTVVLAYHSTTLEKFPDILKDWFEEISEEPKTVWDLEEGDSAWLLADDGDIYEIMITFWYKSEIACGNIFLTRKDAEKELARRKAKQILLRDTKGFKPVWLKDFEPKYEVCYMYSDKNYPRSGLFVHSCNRCCVHANLCFASKEDAEASIKNHAKEWKIYLGVEDE